MSKDLNTFETDVNHFDNINLICTVKSFDLQAIRQRYLNAKKNNNSKVGSVERREVSLGGIVSVLIKNGKAIQTDVLTRIKEPRGIAKKDNILAIAAEDTVYILDQNQQYKLTDPWFSYIHTIDFHPEDKNLILVSSSGYDCFFEYNWRTGQKEYEWFAWEHGFNKAKDPQTGGSLFLTRSVESTKTMIKAGKDVILIKDPEKDVLPTAKRAAFINSVYYDPEDPDRFLATFFHEGKVYEINRNGSEAREIMRGFKSPHGGRKIRNGYMATNTSGGIVHFSESGDIDFTGLSGKAEEMEGVEWLQNSILLDDHENQFVTIDSNRNAFIFVDIEDKKKMLVPFDNDWAVQDFVAMDIGDELKRKIKNW